MSKLLILAGAAVSALCMTAAAQAQVMVQEPWVRATVAQQNATGAFMRLSSTTGSTLVQADSNVAKHVEIHEMAMENDVMKMRQIPGIALPAGQQVELKPGGYHIMLIDLSQQVREGDYVPLVLTFEGADGKRETITIDAPARPLNSGSIGHGHQSHQH